jgi:hypothetical protein
VRRFPTGPLDSFGRGTNGELADRFNQLQVLNPGIFRWTKSDVAVQGMEEALRELG